MKKQACRIQYTLVRQRRKTITMKVMDDLTILVKAPLLVSQNKIDAFVLSHTDWLEKQKLKIEKRTAALNLHTQKDVAILKQEALKTILPLVDYYSKLINLYPSGVKITSAKKRFGSCNNKGNICFSCFLMGYPKEAIEYVIVHELAHLKHMNHSKAFYALVENVLPDYKKRKKLLNI